MSCVTAIVGVLVFVLAAGCGGNHDTVAHRAGPYDAGVYDAGLRDAGPDDAGIPCNATTPCQNDSTCVAGYCVPFGTPPADDRDRSCTRVPAPLDHFTAVVQCEWPGTFTIEQPGRTSVRTAPLVADLDGDGVPEIIFTSWRGTDDPHGTYDTFVRVIRGDTCAPEWTSDRPGLAESQQLAVGDVNGDGHPEVCGRDGTGQPYCLNPDGTLLWNGHNADGSAHFVAPSAGDIGISIADVDGDGQPEVIVGLSVFDGATGLFLRGIPAPPALWGWSSIIPAIADIDGNGHMDALTGGLVYDLVTGETTDWHTPSGYTAVAEIVAASPGPEVVTVSPDPDPATSAPGEIRIQAADGTVLWRHDVPGGNGGPPTIADLDGDGAPEIAVAGHAFFTAFDPDCITAFAPGPDETRRCAAGGSPDGVLWSIPTHDFTSGITGSSVFDFEGDGKVEVVYADECWARVLDGATGHVKFSAPHESATGVEYPTVADADGDGFTELLVPHELWAGCPATDPLAPGTMRDPGRRYSGLTVYRDVDDRWAPSRPLWTQHTEHFDERGDHGAVPAHETPSWTTHNTYREALPAEGRHATDAPDLTVAPVDPDACDLTTGVQPLAARVCNRGTGPAPAGVAVEFHVDAIDGPLACATTTTEPIAPATCVPVACDWPMVPRHERHSVVVVADPPSSARVEECHEDNNTAVEQVVCPPDLI